MYQFLVRFPNLQKPGQTWPQCPLKLKPEEEPTNHKTSPQPDQAAALAGTLSHRWDLINYRLKYCFTLGFSLSMLAAHVSTLASALAPWITGQTFQFENKFQTEKRGLFWLNLHIIWRGMFLEVWVTVWFFHPNAPNVYLWGRCCQKTPNSPSWFSFLGHSDFYLSNTDLSWRSSNLALAEN